MSRLTKLVPAEAVGPFPILMESARQLPLPPGSPRWGVYFVAWVLLLVVIVLRARTTSDPDTGPQWGAVFIAAVAFVIWAHVLGGDFGFFDLGINKMLAGTGADATRSPGGNPMSSANADQIKGFVSNVALTAWTLAAPAVYRGDESTPA